MHRRFVSDIGAWHLSLLFRQLQSSDVTCRSGLIWASECSIFSKRKMAAILDFYGSGRLGRENKLYRGGGWRSEISRGAEVGHHRPLWLQIKHGVGISDHELRTLTRPNKTPELQASSDIKKNCFGEERDMALQISVRNNRSIFNPRPKVNPFFILFRHQNRCVQPSGKGCIELIRDSTISTKVTRENIARKRNWLCQRVLSFLALKRHSRFDYFQSWAIMFWPRDLTCACGTYKVREEFM